jgi:hypothetical protein
MHKSESPQCLSAQRIRFECGNKNSPCISDDYMGNAASSVDKYAYLTVKFMRMFCQISGEFRTYNFPRDSSSVNPLKGMEVTGFEP